MLSKMCRSITNEYIWTEIKVIITNRKSGRVDMDRRYNNVMATDTNRSSC